MTQSISSMVNAISQRVDEHLADKPAEAILWHRIGKLAEESGEVVEALIALTGGNFRKPSQWDADAGVRKVRDELLDVALCALCAWAHTTENKGDSLVALRQHAIKIRNRAGISANDGAP